MSGALLNALPQFPVELERPDLTCWRNAGEVPGFVTREGPQPGPHVLLMSLVHGNEIAGAIVLDRMLRAGIVPLRGRLTLGFANLDAFDRFDPAQPTLSRFVDEDLNRVWDPAVLDGARDSAELSRARQIRPLLDAADIVVDLHSMLWPSDPLILSGTSARGRALAQSLGTPDLVVSDHGHQTGPRLIDYPRFAEGPGGAAACLVEAGQHWQRDTLNVVQAAVDAVLRRAGMIDGAADVERLAAPRCAEVTLAVTAATSAFAFVRPWRGGEVVAQRNTLIALDGEAEIRTPHDECLLVMPSLRASRGHTAVRLARFV